MRKVFAILSIGLLLSCDKAEGIRGNHCDSYNGHTLYKGKKEVVIISILKIARPM